MSYLSEDAGLIRRMLPAEARPPADVDDLFLIYAVLLRAKGDQVTAADVHNAWAAWMQARDPGHPALVPFEALTPAAQREDLPYVHAIHAAFRQIAQGKRG